MEIKKADAGKKAAVGRNEANKEVAKSDAELAVTQAEGKQTSR